MLTATIIQFHIKHSSKRDAIKVDDTVIHIHHARKIRACGEMNVNDQRELNDTYQKQRGVMRQLGICGLLLGCWLLGGLLRW